MCHIAVPPVSIGLYHHTGIYTLFLIFDKKKSINLLGTHSSLEVPAVYLLPGVFKMLSMDMLANVGLGLIFILVLILPFRVKCIEHNLEVFLFACGVVALTLLGLIIYSRASMTGWSQAIVQEALLSPLHVTSLFGIPLVSSRSCSYSAL